MNTIKRYLLSVLFLCVSLSAFSQASVYPIQLSAAMLPPYTNCMGDYFSNGRVQLKVIVRDMSRYDASLEYSISVKIKQGGRVVLASKGPLKRRFSQAQIVNDISLKDLFSDRSNYTVTGGANNFFDNGYCLEEGSYEFEYQLFDKNNGKMPLSEPFSVYCYLTQAEPPVGVFPEDGKCYEESELPQTILFQWIDPIAIGPQNRSYELHIKENGTDMNFTGNMFSTQDAPSSMEFYNQNVYNNNFVLINNSSGKFNVGNTYYWYVQTKSVADGIHGQNAYKNNGKSQTYSFSIGNCHQEEPKIDFDDSKAKNKAKTKVRIELDEVKVEGDVVTPKWELKSNKDNELICGFKIYCYKAGGNPDDASEVKNMTFICDKFMEGYMWTDNLNSSVLEKGVEYFCFVRPVVKDGAIGLKSNEISFKLASPNASSSSKNEDDGCGVDLEHRPCEELLTTVPKYFFANDGHQVILVDQTTKLEGDAFTGAGIITPAWLKNMVPDVMPLTGLNVEFEKIKINSDGYLCEGEIKVVSDPATNLYFDLNELVDFKAGSDAAAKQREVYTKEVDKKEDIKGDDFNGQIVHEKSTGDLYAVPMGGGTPEKVAKCLNKREYCPLQYRGALNDAGIYLRFDVDATLNDGYSPYIDKEAKPFTAENILNGYVSSGSDYIQPWISMVQGETKYIKAYFEGGSVDPDDVEFYLISQNSIALLEKSYENGYFKVRIYGGQPTRSLQIVARSKAKKKDCSDGNNSDSKDGNATNTDTNAGTNGNSASSDNDSNKNSNDCEECEAVTYGSAQIYMLSSKKIKVMLVPVVQNATDNNLNIDDLKAKVSAANDIINQRFAPLGRQFELVVDAAFEYKDIDPTTGFNVSEDNSEWTKETEEMKALRKAYGLEVGKRDEYQACLFLLTQAQKPGLQGYMPRSNSVGFIFLGDNFANVQSDIMAHELCHGLFGLQHTFAYAGVKEGDVKENLMDYVAHNDERYLSKYFQWNNMERFNGHVFKLLDDVEDGEASINPWLNFAESVAQEIVEVSVEAFDKGLDSPQEIYEYALCDDNDKTFSWSKAIDRGKGIGEKMVNNATGGGMEIVSILLNAGSTIKSAGFDCDPTKSDYMDCVCNGGGASLLLGLFKSLGGAIVKKSTKSTSSKEGGSNTSDGSDTKKSNNNGLTESEKSIASAPVHVLVNTGVDQLFSLMGISNDKAKDYAKKAVNAVVDGSADAVIEALICDGLKLLIQEPVYTETQYYLNANIVTEKGDKYLIIDMNCDYDNFENEVEEITIANKTDNGIELIKCQKDTKLASERNSLKKERDDIDPESEKFTGGFKYYNLYNISFPSSTPENQLVLTNVDALLENKKKLSTDGGSYSQYELTNYVRYRYKMKLQCDDIELAYVSIKALYDKGNGLSMASYHKYLSHPLFTEKKSEVKTEYDKTNSPIKESSGYYIQSDVKVTTDGNLVYGCNPIPPNKEPELEPEPGPDPEPEVEPKKKKKTEDTPPVKTITLSKEDMLAIYTKYCCWYVEKVNQYFECDVERQEQTSCFLGKYASAIALARKINLQTNMYSLFDYLRLKYSEDEIKAESTITYTDEYDLVKQIYDSISNELKAIDEADFYNYNNDTVLNIFDVGQSVFNAFFLRVLVEYRARKYLNPQLNAPTWFGFLNLDLPDKTACGQDESCSRIDKTKK